MQHKSDEDDSDHNVEFIGGNVHLVTTKEAWEAKLAEARTDGKIVSIHHILASISFHTMQRIVSD